MKLSRRSLFGALALAATPVPAKPKWTPPEGAIATHADGKLIGWRVARVPKPNSYKSVWRMPFTLIHYDIFDLEGNLIG